MSRDTVSGMKFTLLLAAAVAALAQTPDATGWSAAKWGMTAAEVQAAFPTVRPVNPPEKDLGQFIRLEAPAMQLGNYQATAKFKFPTDQDRLTAVNVSVSQDAARPSAFDALKDGLTAKYGKPTSSDTVSERTAFGSTIETRSIVWRLKSSMVTLEWIESKSFGIVTVRYAERKPDPTL